MPLRRGLAFITAIAACAALTLQLTLLVAQTVNDGGSTLAAVWRFLGFFTIIMNLMAAAIVFGGLVYSVLLRAIRQPTGWQAVADHALHDVTPVLFFLTWLVWDHGELRWRDALWAAAPPLAYCGYAFARGAADGWYAYWFLNPEALNLTQLAASIVLLTAAFLIIAVTLVGIDRLLAGRSDVARPTSQSGSRNL